MRYEVVLRSMNTGGVISVISGFDNEAVAEERAQLEMDDESVWAEVRPERY